MLTAVLADLVRLPWVHAVTLLEEENASLPMGVDVRRAGRGKEEQAFRGLAAAADFTLVIAPECDGILETRCRWVGEVGGRLLGPEPAAVRLTGDKLLLGACLHERGVPTPPCGTLARYDPASLPIAFPAVCKPRHGAGSQATFFLHSPGDVPACIAQAREEGWPGELIVQPYVRGRAASVALLLGPHQQLPLAPAWQRLSADGRFRYQGGALPLPADLAGRAQHLALTAVQAVDGLCGYVGVDLVLAEPADGSGDQVIEINPRLTTSYVGLRALAVTNLMETLLQVVSGEEVAELVWRPGNVEFHRDGRVRITGDALPAP
jgi:predicted ATP-grasp superfamily ATP-dependent carboligase